MELSAWGAAATRNTLQALATGSKAYRFQVRWQEESEKERCLQFVAEAFLPWEDYLRSRIMNTRSISVQAETRGAALARSICSALQAAPPESRAIRVYASLEDEAAMAILAKGLASSPDLYPFKALRCICNVVTPMDHPVSRLIAYLTFSDHQAVPEASPKEFHAYPPADASSEAHRRFAAAVQDRLQMGYNVKMNCRGPEAVVNALRAFCLLKVHVAEFRVRWDLAEAGRGDRSSEDAATSQARALEVEAVRGPTWQEFNSIDFQKTGMLKVSAKTPIGKLAYAAVEEVRQKGAVSLHCYSDNKEATAVLMKALATVRSLSGKQFCCFPSFGRAGENPVLRVYARRRQPGAGGEDDQTAEKRAAGRDNGVAIPKTDEGTGHV